MKKRYLFWFLTVCLSALCSSQVMAVRIVNARNGHPLPRLGVSFSLLYESSEKVPAKYEAKVRLETDAKGKAQFDLPVPAPAHVSVRADLPSAHWRCRCAAPVLVATQDVIQKGIVEGDEF